MDLLRLTLVIIGLAIVIGIYIKFRSSDEDFILWLKKRLNARHKNKLSDEQPGSDENDLIPVLSPIDDEPDLHDFEALSQIISGRGRFEEYAKQQEITFSAVEDATESGPESLLVVLNIMSPKGQLFTGEGIHAVMTSAGLVHGEHQIYHYLQDNSAVFSIANAIEPGYFDLSRLQSTTTPGLAIFMQLPGPVECRKALESLLEISKRLASALSAELCDENRSVLTQQTISHLTEKVENYRIKQQTSQRQKRH